MDIKEFANYCRENIGDFDKRLDLAWDRVSKMRCPFVMADMGLTQEVFECLDDYCAENGLEVDDYDIEDLMGEI